MEFEGFLLFPFFPFRAWFLARTHLLIPHREKEPSHASSARDFHGVTGGENQSEGCRERRQSFRRRFREATARACLDGASG